MFSKYPDAARLLVSGRLHLESGADFSPFYLLLNAVIGPQALRWIQSILGAGCLIAVYATARKLFGRWPAVLAAVLFALAVPVLVYEATLEPDLWVMGLGATAIALLMVGSESTRRVWVLAAGGALGLSVAARPSSLPFLFLAVGWCYANERLRAGAPWLKPGLLAATAVLSSAVPGFTLRLLAGEQSGATMSPGAVLHHGNRPEGTGLGAQPPLLIKQLELQLRSADNPDPVHGLYRRFARASEGGELSAAQTERYWMQKVAAFALNEPTAFASNLYRKLCFFVFGPDGHDVSDARLAATRLERLPLIRTQWLGLLGSVGLLLLLVDRKRGLALIGFYVATTMLLALTFYVVSRYRLATLPLWCVLTAGLAASVPESIRRYRRLGVGMLTLGGAALWATGSSAVAHAQRMLERGGVASERAMTLEKQRAAGDLEAAERTFVEMQGAQPFVLLTRDLRGIAFEAPRLVDASQMYSAARFGDSQPGDAYFKALLSARAGDCAGAQPDLDRAIAGGFRSAIFDLSLDPFLLEARCALQTGDKTAARAWIARSLESRPGTLDALAFAAAGGDQKGHSELFALHDPLSARFALAQAHLAFGDPSQALDDADAVLVQLPEAGVVHYQRALALAALGRLEDAADAYDRALTLFPAHAFEGRPLEAAVQARLAHSPEDPAVLALGAEHRLRAGDLAAAKELADRADALWEGNAPASQRARQRFLDAARAAGSR
jgi:tetratricopeptide (TPR) repeat protein